MLITFPFLVLAALRLTCTRTRLSSPPTNIPCHLSMSRLMPSRAPLKSSGTLAQPNASYAFDCSFAAGYIAFVWFDDHLICHTTPIPFGNSISSTDGNPAYPLPFTAGTTSTVVVRISSASAILNDEDITALLWVRHRSVRWSAPKRAVAHDAKLDYHGVPPSALHPDVPSLEKQRRALQDGLKTGWNLWGYISSASSGCLNHMCSRSPSANSLPPNASTRPVLKTQGDYSRRAVCDGRLLLPIPCRIRGHQRLVERQAATAARACSRIPWAARALTAATTRSSSCRVSSGTARAPSTSPQAMAPSPSRRLASRRASSAQRAPRWPRCRTASPRHLEASPRWAPRPCCAPRYLWVVAPSAYARAAGTSNRRPWKR